MWLSILRARRPVRLTQDRRGTVTLFIAVWLLVIFGLAAVGVDGGYWYLQRRQQQNAADMAAIAGAVQVATDVNQGLLNGNGTPAGTVSTTTSTTGAKSWCPRSGNAVYQVKQSAMLVSCANGFVNGQDGTSVAVNWPPTSGTHQTDTAVEVIVHKPPPLLFTRVVATMAGMNPQTIGARAVAAYTTISAKACVIQLSPQGTFAITGSSAIEAPDCTFVADSILNGGNKGNYGNTNNAAFYVSGNTGTGKNATTGTSASTRNIYAIASQGSCINCSTATQTSVAYTGAAPSPDPFASTIGTLGQYFEGSPNLTDKRTAYSTTTGANPPPPGEYSGISVSGGATLDLSPGLYVIGSGGLNVMGTLNCSGCTFILTNGGTVNINGGTNEVLTAPTLTTLSYTDPVTSPTTWLTALANLPTSTTSTPPPFFVTYPQLSSFSTIPGTLASYFSGLLMYGDANGYKNIDASTIEGGPNSTIAGALYFPTSSLSLSGNSTIGSTTNPDCLMAVAGNITFTGNNTTGMTSENCSDMGLPSVYVHYVELVE